MPKSSPGRRSLPATTAEAASAAGAALPPLPELRRRRPAPRRRTAHTVEAIVAAAIEVLDEAGVAGFSMRRVAERLGTGPASLYAHVAGRDELLELVFDELVGQVPLPEADPARWREQLHESLRGLRDILIAHRDAALAGIGRIPTTPQTLAGAEALAALLRAGGLSDRVVALGVDQLTLYVCACAFEAGLYDHSGVTPGQLRAYFDAVHALYAALPPERFPVLASISEDLSSADRDERFEFGLDAMIAGLEALSARG